MSIKKSLEYIKSCCTGDVTLVGVTKNTPANEINDAIKSGITDIGENRVASAEEKFPHISGVKKHFIGHLQSNKVSKAVELFDMIQTIDSKKIADKISRLCVENGKVMPVLVQIRTDPEKDFGVEIDDAVNFIRNISGLMGISVKGIMTIGPLYADPENMRPIFRKMKLLFDNIKSKKIPNVEMKYLSMGMSHDFKQAIEEGSNMVRIGSAIFGK